MAKKHRLLPIMSGMVNTMLSARLGSMQLFMYANSSHPRSPLRLCTPGPTLRSIAYRASWTARWRLEKFALVESLHKITRENIPNRSYLGHFTYSS